MMRGFACAKPLRVLQLMSGGADRRLSCQCGEWSVRDSGNGHVVDLPARSARRLISADVEANLHILIRISDAEVEGDGGEVRPADHPVYECLSVGADRSGGDCIRLTVVRGDADVGPCRAVIRCDLNDTTAPAGGLEREPMLEGDG